ncbi:hypothetical protein [Streptomyces sp. Ncost-T10-10d]|uniref:hypothetical protein n=1 Tax=Streptomyces sp. Ncost-T10-10d TaxID=1839774 RepID=UPI00114CFAB1|nr:hypothetical protein [Streptomyces sp. Ncost-T10-10d]
MTTQPSSSLLLSSVSGAPEVLSPAAARALSLVSPSRDRVLARQVVVRRLFALDESGGKPWHLLLRPLPCTADRS